MIILLTIHWLHDLLIYSFLSSERKKKFYLTAQDVGLNRADVCVEKLRELNNYVQVSAYTGNLSPDYINKFSVIVLTQSSHLEQLELSKHAHENNIAVIIASTAGLFGQIFCDFGDEFTCIDTSGEQPLQVMVAFIANDKEAVVSCLDETRHGFEDGDYVTFSEVQGMTELNNCQPMKIKVIGPYSFSIGDTTGFSPYIRGGFAKQVKMPTKFQFKPLHEALKEPEFLYSDFAKMDRPIQLHIAFRALNEFRTMSNGISPKPWSRTDAEKFLNIFSHILKTEYPEHAESIDKSLIEKFSFICSGNVSPMQAVIGGIVAQEVLKACTGKFVPIKQWFYYDALECLPLDQDLDEAECAPVNSRYDGQIAVFGKKFQEKILNLNYFIVGAGAIGCELLKNFALMGVGCSPNPSQGKVIITDMDIIEKSNLNRQFLFRSWDVGTCKSITAGNAAKRMNPDFKIVCHQNRVCPETETIYNDDFYEELSGVANALDNVDARIYMDRRCVYYRKSLLESGTLGTKGNNQVVIPFLTESYSSSQDPPEKSIPICTLKNFPNAIEHTLRWARDEFEGLFRQGPDYAAQFLADSRQFFEKSNRTGEALDAVRKLLVETRATTFSDCVRWARFHFEEQFGNQIKQLLYNFPPDQLTSTGTPFWSGPKRCPHPIKFDINNEHHIDYISSAANLYAYVFNIPQCRDRRAIVNEVAQIHVPEFTPRNGVKIAVNDAEASAAYYDDDATDKERINHLLSELPPPEELKSIKINPIDFEKDDDTNFHMDFIVACSNLRANNYDIEPADRHKSKLIAGRIIPAIATTTSVVTGLSCLELFKLAQGHSKLEMYKNGFVNLALPFFGFSEPIQAPKQKYYNNEFTIWDRFEVEGEMTLREFIDYFKNVHNLEVTMLTQGVTMLYSFFLSQAKVKERNEMTLTELVRKVSKKKIDPQVKALVFEICCNDDTGEDVEVPYVRYILPRS